MIPNNDFDNITHSKKLLQILIQNYISITISGYAETIGGIIEKESGISRRDWHRAFCGIPRREIILMSATALAHSYQKALSCKVDDV